MIILVGPSASGKTEVSKILATEYGITKVITHTTRPKRIHEINDRDYHFVSKETFEELKRQKAFVETTIYNDNFYGTSKAELNDDKCLIVDPQGVASFMALNDPRIVTFGLFASKETLKRRMKERGDSDEIINKRLLNDQKIFSDSLYAKVDYCFNSEAYTLEELAHNIVLQYRKHLSKSK